MKTAFITVGLAAILMVAPMASAQHSRGGNQHNGGQRGGHGEQHGERGRSDRGHGRNEGRRVDEGYRGEHFGREHAGYCRDLRYGNGLFFFGGIWFGLEVWPGWYPNEVVYVDYIDGDYFLVNARLDDRVAIVIE